MQYSRELPGQASNNVVLLDAPAEAQTWFGAFLAAVSTGAGNLPHAHPNLPAAQITFEQLVGAIAKTYRIDGKPWSVEVNGYPPIPGASASAAAKGTDRGVPDHGSVGSDGHNLLHNLLGDFH